MASDTKSPSSAVLISCFFPNWTNAAFELESKLTIRKMTEKLKLFSYQHKIARVVNFTRSFHEAIQFPEFLDGVHRPDIFHTVVVVLSFEHGFSFRNPESVGMLEWIVITHYNPIDSSKNCWNG